MEENQIEYILTNDDKINRAKALDILKKSKEIQRFLYFTDAANISYNGIVVSKKKDKISIINKHYTLRFGNNNLFIGSTVNSGITYNYKGRSNQRLNFWKKTQVKGVNTLAEMLAVILDLPHKELFELGVIRQIATKGLLGSIMSGNITNTDEAMQYYIRYSLRGSGIKQDRASSLYEYLKHTRSYTGIIALRVAVDPNILLDQFHPNKSEIPKYIIKFIGDSHQLILMANAVNEKVDWVNPHFNVNNELSKFTKKAKKIKEFLQLWEGGPVLGGSMTNPVIVNPINNISLPSEMPF